MINYIGLYVHIPFCEKKCDYCNFVSFCCGNKEKEKYVSALQNEIEIQGKIYSKKNYVVDTIFIGGGTPTTMLDGQIELITRKIKQCFVVDKNAEVTIECNPNSLTREKLVEFKNCGINRLSIGLQTYNDRLLKLIGRLHTKKQFDNSIKLAKSFGFDNINVDIMLGLPNQKMSDVKRTIKHLKKLDIQHISAYGLIVEDSTKLKKNLDNNLYSLPSEDIATKMYDWTNKYLKKHKIFRYEVSNFSKVGFECKHNLKYWQDKEYLGLGVVSSSYVENTRWKNVDSLAIYQKAFENVSKIDLDNLPLEDVEKLDKQSKIEECIMLSLRTAKGIDLQKFQSDFGFDLRVKKQKKIDELVESGFIKIENNFLFCTDVGFKLLNQIILELI